MLQCFVRTVCEKEGCGRAAAAFAGVAAEAAAGGSAGVGLCRQQLQVAVLRRLVSGSRVAVQQSLEGRPTPAH